MNGDIKQLLIDCLNLIEQYTTDHPIVTRLQSALAQPAAQGEAVAWQYRHRDGEWAPCTKEQYEHVLRTGNFGVVGDECEARALCVRSPQQSAATASDCYDLRPDDSIKQIAEEMVSVWSAARQGDAEITLDIVDEWMHRIMCFADYVRPGTHPPQQQVRVTVTDEMVKQACETYNACGAKVFKIQEAMDFRMRGALEAVADQLAASPCAAGDDATVALSDLQMSVAEMTVEINQVFDILERQPKRGWDDPLVKAVVGNFRKHRFMTEAADQLAGGGK